MQKFLCRQLQCRLILLQYHFRNTRLLLHANTEICKGMSMQLSYNTSTKQLPPIQK